MSKFFEFLDAATAKAAESAVGKIMIENGYSVAHTGGGCLAWEKSDAATGWVIMICDEGNGLGDTLDEQYLVGLHANDGDFLECEDALSLMDCLAWGAAAIGHKQVLKVLADNDGACLYWQMPDAALVKAALDNCVVKQVGELLVHPDAVEVTVGECYTMSTEG